VPFRVERVVPALYLTVAGHRWRVLIIGGRLCRYGRDALQARNRFDRTLRAVKESSSVHQERLRMIVYKEE
jgi:ABC-type Fe2+-enterobactin transport system substrate-binding protein